MIGRCFVASAIYAQMIVCVRPCTGNLADLFNSVRQVLEPPVTGKSGLDNLLARAGANRKIGLQRAAKVNLEIALLADGVMPDMVYGLLETDAGVQRAFAKLDTIKSNIVWWRNSSEPAELLRKGQVAATTILTEDAQTALQNTDRALVSSQFMEADVLALPKSDVKSDRALDYLRFATGTAPLANMVKFAPYMPPRRSAMPLVEKLPASPTRDFVASQKNPMHAPFAINDDWWAEHGPALEARFRAWLGPA